MSMVPPISMTPDFAELLGMHAGDGTIYRTQWSVVWELRGNLNEKEFYDSYIVPLLNRIHSYPFKAKFRSGGKNGCYGVRCCDKEFIKRILNEGFCVGKKTKTVEIPKSILGGSKEIQAPFLKGLFATDGTAYVSNRIGLTSNYPIIEVASASFKLVEQVHLLLNGMGIKNYCWNYQPKLRGGPAMMLRLNGFKQCSLFLDEIGLSNPKHMAKLSHVRQNNKNI